MEYYFYSNLYKISIWKRTRIKKQNFCFRFWHFDKQNLFSLRQEKKRKPETPNGHNGRGELFTCIELMQTTDYSFRGSLKCCCKPTPTKKWKNNWQWNWLSAWKLKTKLKGYKERMSWIFAIVLTRPSSLLTSTYIFRPSNEVHNSDVIDRFKYCQNKNEHNFNVTKRLKTTT